MLLIPRVLLQVAHALSQGATGGQQVESGGVWSHQPFQPHLISVSHIKIPGKKWLKSQEGGQISSSLIFKGYLMKLS